MHWRGTRVIGMALGLLGWAGCGYQGTSPLFTPSIHAVVQSVPAMPSVYAAFGQNSHLFVSSRSPWVLVKTRLAGDGRRRFSLPVTSRPRIVYIMPHAVALMATHPVLEELLVNTRTGYVKKIWRLPHRLTLSPASMGGFADHTFFWQVSAGVQGPVAAYGGYDMKTRRPLSLSLAQMEGRWFEDPTRGVLFDLRGQALKEWQNGKWVADGQLPSDPVNVISQQGWIMTARPQGSRRVTVSWSNIKSGQAARLTLSGNLEASGADWVLVLQGTRLILGIPSKHTETIVARHVTHPLIANNAVYWQNAKGQVRRVRVNASVVSAIPDIVWP